MKKTAFISHIHEESRVAEYLKEWLEESLLGQLEVFVSTIDMRPGAWLDQVRQSLQGASFAFPLLSQAAIERPWINFESGGAFISEQVQLVPVCHRDLAVDRLVPPYSLLQSYDLRSANSVSLLLRNVARELDLRTPTVDIPGFCDRIAELDASLNTCYTSFADLKASPDLAQGLAGTTAPLEVELREDQLQVWNDLELRARLHHERVLELQGYTRDAMGLNISQVPVPRGSRYLIVKATNSTKAVSNDRDRFLKLSFNMRTPENAIPAHKHYGDEQYTIKGDGFFVFHLPYTVLADEVIDTLTITFWKIDLRELLLEFYFA